MACFICRNEEPILNKICVCEDSLICNDCLALNNENVNREGDYNENRLKCSVCRRFLSFSYYKNRDYYFNMIWYYLIKIICIISDISPIIYVYQLPDQFYPNALYANSEYFLISCMLQVIFFKFIIKESFLKITNFSVNNNNNIREKMSFSNRIDLIYFCLNITFLIVLYLIKSNNTSDTYTLLYLVPLYYIPFFSIILVNGFLSQVNIKNYYSRKYSKKKIMVRSLIYNRDVEV